MIIHLVILWKWLRSRTLHSCKRWTRPHTLSLSVGALTDVTRTRSDLIAENALLRQQLIVLRRQVKRPELTTSDRIGVLVVVV